MKNEQIHIPDATDLETWDIMHSHGILFNWIWFKKWMNVCLSVWSGLVWSGLAWNGMEWNGTVWYGMVWYGMYIHMPSGYINIAMENGPFVDDFWS